MRIQKITHQHRRDFSADFICEHCGNIDHDSTCYDDTYYHSIVIPAKKCSSCGKIAGDDYQPKTTKYPNGLHV